MEKRMPECRIIIGALAGNQYDDRQQRCRNSWFRDALATEDIRAFFLFGRNSQGVTEPKLNGDELYLPCPNAYGSLPQRTNWFCRWALTIPGWKYLFKCDDDTYVSIPRLAAYDTAERPYIGGEWQKGRRYGSGGGGYFLSRAAAQIIANQLRINMGNEDELVGAILAAAGVLFHDDQRFVGFGNPQKRPKPDNDIITAHGISPELFWRCHHETRMNDWPFRIVMPVSNQYSKVAITSLKLLEKYWPQNPRVDVLHHDKQPPNIHQYAIPHHHGNQTKVWTEAMRVYLETQNPDEFVMLMLEDYGIFAPVRVDLIRQAHEMLTQVPELGCIHLTWQPPKKARHQSGLLQIPRGYDYSVNTQAALWRRSVLLEVLKALGPTTAENFELGGSRWLNEHLPNVVVAQVLMDEPKTPGPFVDGVDNKHLWAVPYHNLCRRGSADPRHAKFLESEGVKCEIVQ